MKISYDISHLKLEDQQFFTEMLSYVSPFINKIAIEAQIVIISCDENNSTEVQDKVSQLDQMIVAGKMGNKEVKIKTLEDYTDQATINLEEIFSELLNIGAIKKITSGVFAYSDIFLNLYRYFNKKIDEFGFSQFAEIKEFEFPVLYPIEQYEKGGYFETFPHYIMFQTVMKNDLEVLDRFSKEGTADKRIFEQMNIPQNVLRNAACVPVYALLRDEDMSSSKSFLVSGKCFRNEGENTYELARLKEFFMKEYVFVGTPEYCMDSIGKARELWTYWQKMFSLNCKIETANDSFFASNYRKLKLFQVLGESKLENKWKLPHTGQYIACSSANFHRTHFTKPYEIRKNENEYCYSACFAFGIERLAYAFLCQKGLNTAKWDQETYDEISKYVNIRR